MKKTTLFAALLLVAVALAGCGGTLTPVKIPIPVECREAQPVRPLMPTEQLKLASKEKPGVDPLLQASLAENERREGYEGLLLTALTNCTTAISK